MDIKRTDKLGATIDHVLPISKGGLDTMENVALAHWICNIRKGNKL
jgi:5-methylcytosine-specific restriction endonuclease McrA